MIRLDYMTLDEARYIIDHQTEETDATAEELLFYYNLTIDLQEDFESFDPNTDEKVSGEALKEKILSDYSPMKIK